MTTHDDERRTRESRAVMQALGRLHTPPATETAPPLADQLADPDGPANGLQVAADPGLRPFNPLLVLLDLGLAFLLTMLLAVPLTLVFLGLQDIDVPALLKSPDGIEGGIEAIMTPGYFAASALVQALAFVLVVWLRVRALNRRPWSWLGLSRGAFAPSALGWGLVGGLGFLAINALFGWLGQQAGLDTPNQIDMFNLERATPVGLAMLGVAIVVLAPLNEELFFRAYAQRVFAERFGAWPGILLGALVFTLPHLLTITQGFVALAFAIFAGGVVLGWVYARTGQLTTAIIAHAINNGAALLALLAAPQIDQLPK